MRVSRSLISAQDLIAAYPSLKQKSLSAPSTLPDSERRLILDLPDKDMEASNIAAVSSLSRGQLIEKALSDRTSLTQEEAALLKDRFWTPHTGEEIGRNFNTLLKVGESGLSELFIPRRPAYHPGEDEAFRIGGREFHLRIQAVYDSKLRETARPLFSNAKEWIQHLYGQKVVQWGFVCLYDAAIQKYDPEQLDDFAVTIEGSLRSFLRYNGTKDIIDQRWRCVSFNSPNTAFAPITLPVHDNASIYQDGAIFRRAFQDILNDQQQYQSREDVAAMHNPHEFPNGLSTSDLLTNTFLVIDPVCLDSVLDSDGESKPYGEMRVLAFEADFPVEGRKYVDGYQGFTWVRLDQLVSNFYELRLLKADVVGMDEIWKAAQHSYQRAFVSMDPEEALNRTVSEGLW